MMCLWTKPLLVIWVGGKHFWLANTESRWVVLNKWLFSLANMKRNYIYFLKCLFVNLFAPTLKILSFKRCPEFSLTNFYFMHFVPSTLLEYLKQFSSTLKKASSIKRILNNDKSKDSISRSFWIMFYERIIKGGINSDQGKLVLGCNISALSYKLWRNCIWAGREDRNHLNGKRDGLRESTEF